MLKTDLEIQRGDAEVRMAISGLSDFKFHREEGEGKRGKRKSITILPDSILRDPNLSSQEKIILWSLKSHKYKTGECRPGRSTIARESGYCMPIVNKTLNSLESKGFFKRTFRLGLPSIYELNPLKFF